MDVLKYFQVPIETCRREVKPQGVVARGFSPIPEISWHACRHVREHVFVECSSCRKRLLDLLELTYKSEAAPSMPNGRPRHGADSKDAEIRIPSAREGGSEETVVVDQQGGGSIQREGQRARTRTLRRKAVRRSAGASSGQSRRRVFGK